MVEGTDLFDCLLGEEDYDPFSKGQLMTTFEATPVVCHLVFTSFLTHASQLYLFLIFLSPNFRKSLPFLVLVLPQLLGTLRSPCFPHIQFTPMVLMGLLGSISLCIIPIGLLSSCFGRPRCKSFKFPFSLLMLQLSSYFLLTCFPFFNIFLAQSCSLPMLSVRS